MSYPPEPELPQAWPAAPARKSAADQVAVVALFGLDFAPDPTAPDPDSEAAVAGLDSGFGLGSDPDFVAAVAADSAVA